MNVCGFPGCTLDHSDYTERQRAIGQARRLGVYAQRLAITAMLLAAVGLAWSLF